MIEAKISLHYIQKDSLSQESDELAENKTLPKAHGPKALSTQTQSKPSKQKVQQALKS